MRRILFSVILIFAVSTISAAQNTTLILLEGLSSKMSTGTPFTAKDASSGKLYKGSCTKDMWSRIQLDDCYAPAR
jgi:hypothetical protein